ncbi:MAG: glycine cleavage system protein GcvH [Caldilinea sp.]|jgi:glycine cleavage system H protein|nr:glycine cleavage system protein GcvH [Chloroflexota bacterium]MCX6041447.1 glycine cleavage system protein GcvH [Caldilinea sp.]
MADYKLDRSVRYAKSHEWVRVEDGIATVGVSDFAQDALSDVVYVDLPEVGSPVSAGKQAATVESVKAAEEVNAPVSGVVIEVNPVLTNKPEQINEEPYAAWFFKVRPTDGLADELAALFSPDDYAAFVAGLG